MKNFLLCILAFAYLAASTGATVQLHYCMGKLADAGFFKEERCGVCGMDKGIDGDNGCCKDEKETVKISIDQKYSTGSIFHFEQPFTDPAALFTDFQPQFAELPDDKVPPVSHAPPRSQKNSVYLLNRNFRI